MIIIIGIFIVIILVSAGITLLDNRWKENKVRHRIFFGWVMALSLAWAVLIVLIINDSYNTYLTERAFYDATVEQYSTAVTMYRDKAVIDIESAAWTDLKYQGYQANVSSLILDLRSRIIEYNKLFIIKNKMHSNHFFSWLIVDMDDDMKIIKMKTASQHLTGK